MDRCELEGMLSWVPLLQPLHPASSHISEFSRDGAVPMSRCIPSLRHMRASCQLRSISCNDQVAGTFLAGRQQELRVVISAG